MMRSRFSFLGRLVLAAAAIVTTIATARADEKERPVDFTRDVRPVLAENCFHCHGPDEAERQADLRLDVWDGIADALGANAVITRTKPDESELIARITTDDPDMRMPPADSGKTLTPEQIETLRKWVAQGAEIRPHWSFVAPQRPPLPEVKNKAWGKNPIDAFVLARLEREGLEPSTAADPNTLLRRLSLDLIGLPPTLEELAAVQQAAGESAIEQEIARLLASPHFGERWGRIWLDVARYADSDGFEKDKPRFVWMYRDWVVESMNEDMPYDQFIVEQIAGDLLPKRTQDDLVATGFLRNSMINEEGGIDPEQFRMEAMFDRMDAIGKGILGLTVQCAQCHTHKYDPISHTDYYRLFAFLNNCNEGQVTVYTDEQNDEWRETYRLIKRIEDKLKADNPNWLERMAEWEQNVRNKKQPEWIVVRPIEDSSGGQKHYVLDDNSILAAGYAPTYLTADFEAKTTLPKITAVRLELMNDPNLPHGGPGRSIYGTGALSEFELETSPLDKQAKWTKQKISKATADVNPPQRDLDKVFDDRGGKRRVTGPIEYANDNDPTTAWTGEVGPGRSNVPRNAVFVLEKPIEMPKDTKLKFRLSQFHGGWNSDDNQNNNLGRFRFSITSSDNAEADPVPADVRAILNVPADARTSEQTGLVFSYWRTTVEDWQEENRRIEALWQSHPRGTTQLALLEREKSRPTHRLDRGNFLAPKEEVTPGVPSFLHPLARDASETEPPNRLDFARWLADRRSPTTARSIVNRIWQAYFGIGLIATAEDLGTQGETPSHPELLDWLAVELMENGWSLKHIHKLIVSSATYRQTSAAKPELFARDPDNRLLARGPRYRMDAEIVRDIALAASGLLNPKQGGPSVYPPAPEFLFQPPSSYGPKTWATDTGPDRYRRAIYTFRFRSVPYPALQNFDAPNGEFACARRARSNTPLQSLTTLNEPLFLESARALGTRIVTDGGTTDAERIAYVVRRCLSREPKVDEVGVLQAFVAAQKERFAKPGADPLLLLSGDEKIRRKLENSLPAGTTAADLAAWTALARVVLNLDETITKE
jgi:mono/diheme cytochrome c family protein